VSSRRAGLVVAFLVVASAAIRFAASRAFEPGWIAPDEAIYSLLGRSLWETGSPALLGAGGYHALVYPALAGLPLTLAELGTGVAILQALQALAMSATAGVAYLWGRRSLGNAWAAVAAALVVAIPGLAYSGLLMTQPLLYLFTTLALWALAAALERPTLRRQAVVAGALALVVLTHVQSVALLPTVFLAVALQCAFARSIEPARRLAVLLGTLAGACVLGGFAAAVSGSWNDPFGAYAAAVGGYELGAALADVTWHAAGAFVVVGGIPLVALALMLVECLRRAERSPAAVALVATATAWSVCLVLEIGIFASRWVGHIAERDLLTLAPPIFLVFGLWLSRGVPRPRVWAQAAALLVAVPAVLLPVKRFAVKEAALDAFSFVPLWRLGTVASETTLEVAFPLVAGALVAAAVLVPRRALVVLPVLVLGVLVTLSFVSTREITQLSRDDRVWVFDIGDPRWVDAASDGPVTYLHASSGFSAGVWKHLFWNDHIDAVAALPAAAPVGPLEPAMVSPRFDGLLLDTEGNRLEADLVAASSDLELAGERIAAAPRSTDLPGLSLWRIERPVRVRTRRDGFQPNGDILGEASVTVYGCGPGRLELTLLGKQGEPVQLTANGIPRQRFSVPGGDVWTGAVTAPPDADGRTTCVFGISSPGLLGSTIIEWIPG
jgi:hypothetical protein